MAEKMRNRNAIVALHISGHSNSSIFDLLRHRGMSRSTVWKAVRRYKEVGSCEDRPKIGRPRSVRSTKVINAVKSRIRRNPQRSMKKMAKEMKVSQESMRRIVKIDLDLRP